ncbi:MAG TPA: GxxExxY protein [Candidatus Moranbacteria bacterium]|nr:GxxExxY protein [Candidatus Moranbacteria bacterium]
MVLVKNKNIYYPELSYEITGLLFKTHNELGRFKTERQYGDFFEELLKSNRYNYCREINLKNIFKDCIDGNIPDFVLENKIIIDFKAKKFITKEDYFQMVRYLDVADLPLGIIVNFRHTYLKPKRILNKKFHSNNSSVHS